MEQCEKHKATVCEPCAYDRGVRDERERCAKAIRGWCVPCGGSGYEREDSEDECEFCGLPIQAIHK